MIFSNSTEKIVESKYYQNLFLKLNGKEKTIRKKQSIRFSSSTQLKYYILLKPFINLLKK